MLMFVIVAAALIWMHYAIRTAERQEWGANQEQTDLPELSTPHLFYPLSRARDHQGTGTPPPPRKP
jgi:NNP family nitrate/nitrite transporter-like MFS transporter